MTKCSFVLPSMKEIVNQIEQCKLLALETAHDFKLFTKKESYDRNIFACEIIPYVPRSTKKSQLMQNTIPITTIKQLKVSDLKGICLKNVEEKTKIEENSPFVELHFKNQTHRTVVKKTSLCWLLRKDWQKVSNDRLRRVQCSSKIVKISQYKSKLKLNKKRKCLMYPYKNM